MQNIVSVMGYCCGIFIVINLTLLWPRRIEQGLKLIKKIVLCFFILQVLSLFALSVYFEAIKKYMENQNTMMKGQILAMEKMTLRYIDLAAQIKMQEQKSLLDLLKELASSLPDKTVLRSIVYEKNKLEMRGELTNENNMKDFLDSVSKKFHYWSFELQNLTPIDINSKKFTLGAIKK